MDKADHVSFDSGVPEIDLKDFVKGNAGAVVAFDDVERCRIQMVELLGYVNAFVEHDEVKAILIANEDEIARDLDSADADARDRYARTKEKLIGQTITITPNLDEALDAFIGETSTATQAILSRYKERIKEVHEQSELQNLRSLRLALLDFGRLLGGLSKEAAGSEALLEAMLERFLIFTIEIKSGALKPESIPEDRLGISSLIGGEKSEKELALERLRDKYRAFASWDPVLTGGLWTEIFNEGLFDFSRINASLATSSFLLKQEQPEWVRLWHGHALEDVEFDVLAEKAFADLRDKKVKSMGVSRHLVSMLLHYQQTGLVPFPRKEIVHHGKAFIDYLRNSGKLLQQAATEFSNLRMNAWQGLGFHSPNAPEFVDFNGYIEASIRQAEEDALPDRAAALVGLMQSDAAAFANQVLISSSGQAQFYKIPIFIHIKPEEFVTALVRLSGDNAILVSQVFDERYQEGNYSDALASELPWLEAVVEKLTARHAELAGRARSIRVGFLLEGLRDAKAKLIAQTTPDQPEVPEAHDEDDDAPSPRSG